MGVIRFSSSWKAPIGLGGGADFIGELVDRDLTGALLEYRDLRNAVFRRCNLQNVSLEGTKFTPETFVDCQFSPQARLHVEHTIELFRQRRAARAKRDAELRARAGMSADI
jgi:Pentapeptide repeats (8 copies)